MNNQSASLPDFAIETEGLSKVYRGIGKGRDVQALTDVSLAIPRGTVFGLLGPNGAGKSTIINILAGLVTKTAGSARIWGHDIATAPRAARAAIGVVPQEIYYDTFFTAREMVEMQAGFYGVPRAERRTMELLGAMGLTEKADVMSRTLSGGMKRRLLVAKALAHDPPVVVLDEPTAGVDIELRHQLWDYLRGLNRRGVTIVLTTHYLEEAEELCDTIAIINHGKVIACEPTPDLIGRLDRKELVVTLGHDLAAVPDALMPFRPVLASPRRLVFGYQPSRTGAAEIITALQAAGVGFVDFTTEEADLEAIFLKLTREDEEPGGPGANGGRGLADGDPQAGALSLSRSRPQP